MKKEIEALFIMSSGFSKSCVQVQTDNSLPISRLAIAVNMYFEKKHHKIFTKKTVLKHIEIGKYIKKEVEPKLKALEDLHDGKTSPQILLVLAIDMLINEYKHTTTRVHFSHFNIAKMIDEVYSIDRYKEFIKSHSDFISSI